MKRLLVSAFFVAGFGAGLLCRADFLGGAFAVAPPAATANGDTNGDGKRDLSDAVYLLNWLFAGGPEPAPLQTGPIDRFVDGGDGTILDTSTQRVWQKGTADLNGDGRIDPESDAVTMEEARAFVDALQFAGHDDWRLPTQMELSSIVDVNRHIWLPEDGGPSIDPTFDAQPASYWVLSSNAGDPCHGSQFIVSFASGAVNLVGAPEAREYVRAVRGP